MLAESSPRATLWPFRIEPEQHLSAPPPGMLVLDMIANVRHATP